MIINFILSYDFRIEILANAMYGRYIFNHIIGCRAQLYVE